MPTTHLVDIKEDPHVRGALLVEATAPDGTIESATFSGPARQCGR